jgi:predicted secreted acid phosphatase
MKIHDRVDGEKLALVLDIDDTALSLYEYERWINFGFQQEDFAKFVEKANMPAIQPTLSLYKFAKKNGVAVFFISGRHESWRYATIKNLQAAGYENWDGLYLRPDKYYYRTIILFKSNTRKLLRSKGYNIVVNIGDQKSDFIGDNIACKFKLPNPYYLVSGNETFLSLN